jgi:hypothetical protein
MMRTALATMYKIEHQITRHPSLSPALASPTSQADAAGSGEWTQAQLVAAMATVVAFVNGSNDSNGFWNLQSASNLGALSRTRGCCEVYASVVRGRSFRGVLGRCDASDTKQYLCALSAGVTSGGGLQYGQTVYVLKRSLYSDFM